MTFCFVASALSAFTVAQSPTVQRACSILTKDLALAHSTDEGKAIIARGQIFENEMGPNTCQIGRFSLLLDPFRQSQAERRARAADSEVVAGLGDAAFIKSDSAFLNLWVWSGARHFAVQVSFGPAETPATVKPRAVAIAKAILAKLS